ncbi:MAG TPA: tyrosine-type recombinase/integrase [Gaiellaceae bacterium]|nr:tyrosine-type recombinase/integrase [Gaiellaceae bacterium]
MRVQIFTLTQPGRLEPLRLIRHIDNLEEERMASIPTGQPPVVSPSVAKPGAAVELKMKAANKSGPVFVSRTGTRLAHRNVERRGFDAAAEDAGIEGVSFHDLRHAYGSRLASRGLTARQIADAMGHKKTSTTEIYIQRYNGEAADERIREAMSG